MGSLDGRAALVSGASSGIGEATARALESLVREIEAAGGRLR
jgi:NADP-dependent 3-hydroxy acid dehydrogenase YdfG